MVSSFNQAKTFTALDFRLLVGIDLQLKRKT